MALFKILRGSSTGLKDLPINDGWCYFTPDTGLFYIDYNGTRVPLNAKDAQTLSGASLVQTLNSEGLDQEILSAAAIDEIKNNLELLIAAKQELITGTEGQVVVIGGNGNPTVIDASLSTSGGIINQNTGKVIKIWRGTKAEYDALETKSDDVMYIITDADFVPSGKSYLTFSSPNSFTLAVNDATKHWDGTLEYFNSNKTWTIWDGTTTLSSIDNDGEQVLYLRGTGNTVIAGNKPAYRWVLTGSDIACIGNIENLLDYATVKTGQHPGMREYCYGYMFRDCTSLTQAPALPATTLAACCYLQMFRNCTSLTQAPVLPATRLEDSCYNSMFYGCTSLTQTPALPATTLAQRCYYNLFYGCTSLTQAPTLPATTLVTYCYWFMFSGCTGLAQVPALPATTLATYCYSGMFNGCTSIKFSATKTGEYTQEYRIPSSGTGTTATNALSKMFTGTGGAFTGTPEINATYYLSSDNMVVRETEIATLNGYVGSMIDSATPKFVSVTLAATSWNSAAKTQTVTVTGVKASETVQIITPIPAMASQSAYYDAGILCTGQAANSLTFTADTIPTANLTVYVVIQEVSA